MSSCPVIKNTIKVARSIQFCKIQGIFFGKDFQNLGEEIEILGKIITPVVINLVNHEKKSVALVSAKN